LPTHLKQSLLALHSAVLLFALSGLFAKWLNMPAIYIVFGRAFFAAIILVLFFLLVKKQSLKISTMMLGAMLLTGVVLAFHWGSFFYAIQVSSVAIGLITFATFPVFVSFLEPLFFKEKFHYQALLQALLTIVGIGLILPLNTMEASQLSGAIWGVLSACSFALLTLLNRKFVSNISAKKVALYQNLFACLIILPYVLFNPITISLPQLGVLALLGIIFTAFAHSIFNHALKVIKAQTASIAISLEPIYGVIAAYFFLGESITWMMFVGGSIVMLTNVWALKTMDH